MSSPKKLFIFQVLINLIIIIKKNAHLFNKILPNFVDYKTSKLEILTIKCAFTYFLYSNNFKNIIKRRIMHINYLHKILN